MLTQILSISAALVPIACFAAPLEYDSKTYCDDMATAMSGDDSFAATCMDVEQSAQKHLKELWPSLSAEKISACDETAMLVGGSYAVFESCVQLEEDAAASSDTEEN